jgi:polar amino acid transport system substrate-binding protein
MRSRILIAIMLVTATVLILASCAPAPTPAPVVQTVVVQQTVAVPQTVAIPQTVVVQPTAKPTVAPTAAPVAPTPVAQVPSDALTQKGKLTVCTDFPYPPQEFFDDKGNPAGTDIDIGNEIGSRLGLQTVYVNSVFDTIIAAVKSGKCDIIISAQNITADRNKQISMIPYFQAGQSMVVQKGNPQKISTPMDLCGKGVAAESGTTEADYLQGNGDYKGKGLVDQCKTAGKPAVTVVLTQKDTDSLQQLQSGKVAAYFADTPPAAYYTVQQPDKFELTGQIVEPAMEGINMPCGDATDCTKAPLTPLGQAVQTALKSMMADGTYAKILAKWNLTSGAVK